MSTKTKFRIFLQPPYVPGFEQPVTVEIETEDKIEAGPADPLLYVLDAENKPKYRAKAPHEFQPFRGRPWKGALNRFVARLNYDGHFDHLKPDDPAFPAASVYATARLVLNFWNRIFSATGLGEIKKGKWHHKSEKLKTEDPRFASRLQLIPRCVSAGSRTGYGYVELGRDNPGHRYREREDGPVRLTYQRGAMWQNFDVIAHEMGHAILFQRIGFPASATEKREWFSIPDPEFLAFHESMADLVAILSLLDLKEAREFVLSRKDGIDIAAGIGELQKLDEPGFLPIRSARNLAKYPGKGRFKNEEAHQNSMSLTGAVFDTLIKVYEAYEKSTPGEAESALAQAHDVVAKSLAGLWAELEHLREDSKGHYQLSFTQAGQRLPTLVSKELEKSLALTTNGKPKEAVTEADITRLFAARNLCAEAATA